MISDRLNLPNNLKLGDFPELSKLQGTLTTGVYRLIFPDGNKGKLLQIKSGELAGLNTTTLVVDGKFSGTAGLEELDLDEYSSRLLSKIKGYNHLAQCFNDLSSRVQVVLNHLDNEYQARVRNMFNLFKDISRKMPELISNENYANMAMSNLAGLKIIAGDYFEYQLINFKGNYSQINYNQRNIDFNIGRLIECKSHRVFQALEILVMIEIYEIMLSGRVTSKMIKAAKEGLMDRLNPIINVLSAIHEYISRLIEDYDRETKNYPAPYHEHLKYIEEVSKYNSRLKEVYLNTLDVRNIISKSLNEDYGMDNLESIYIEFLDEKHLVEVK
ncbi:MULTISPECIES: hypothetical protein [Cronobacter]|uniref:Uncharacterized protein n=1 Tax=Cronobacter malonaticus TaxID=413503 RepID=A0A423XSH3_9ENTR|nr:MULTISPECIES: hypothetical protein [Cronobacter]ROW59477.1 hypothetical protein C3E80_13790 [Cronobacter malonaticus]RRA40144.1 hypothetical protein C4882_14135 [Cronobacter malonaticus]